MSLRILLLVGLAFSAGYVQTAPVSSKRDNGSSDTVTNLSNAQTDAFIKPARLAQIAYCSSKAVLSFNCGPPCEAIPEIQPQTAGGDDGKVPMYFIAHDTADNSIVVAHQGTNTKNIASIVNDAKFALVNLDAKFFPNLQNSDIKVHDGFKEAFERTADGILGNVTQLMKSKNTNKIVTIGHSLGAALAVMDAAFLKQNLGSSASISTKVFGLPRTGNKAWADFVGEQVPDLTHIHNKNDPVGRLPPTFLGFNQIAGEVHIIKNGTSVECPGEENQNANCVDKQSILGSSIADHIGPYYDGISMSGANCPL